MGFFLTDALGSVAKGIGGALSGAVGGFLTGGPIGALAGGAGGLLGPLLGGGGGGGGGQAAAMQAAGMNPALIGALLGPIASGLRESGQLNDQAKAAMQQQSQMANQLFQLGGQQLQQQNALFGPTSSALQQLIAAGPRAAPQAPINTLNPFTKAFLPWLQGQQQQASSPAASPSAAAPKKKLGGRTVGSTTTGRNPNRSGNLSGPGIANVMDMMPSRQWLANAPLTPISPSSGISSPSAPAYRVGQNLIINPLLHTPGGSITPDPAVLAARRKLDALSAAFPGMTNPYSFA